MYAARCRICGEALIAECTPGRCPYCAVETAHLRGPGDFTSSENRIQPTETERRDLEDLTEVVRALARTALGAARTTSDDGASALFERLAWIHAEHVRVLCLLASESHGPEWLQPMAVEDDEVLARQGIEMRLAESAVLYEKAAGRATAPRVREVFSAFSEADSALSALLRD